MSFRMGLYDAWVQMLLQIGPLLRMGLYYAWNQMLLQMGPLSHLGPIITLVPSTRIPILM